MPSHSGTPLLEVGECAWFYTRWFSTELNQDPIVFQAKSARRKPSTAVGVSLLAKNKLPRVSKPECKMRMSALSN